MTSFGSYLRCKICGVVQSRRAKTVPRRAFGWFQEFNKALKIPGKQESEIILPWEKKLVVQKKYLYLDRAIGDNNGMTHYKTFRQWIGLCRTATASYIPKTFKCLETRILPWLSYRDFRENCNSRQCFLQCVFHQVILIKQTRFWVKLQCDFSHKAGKLKPIFSYFTLKTIRNHDKKWTNLPAVEENAWQKMNTKRPAITIRSETIFNTIWQ